MRQALLLLTLPLIALPLTLGACKKEGAADQSQSSAAAAVQAESMPRPLPGLYRSSAELVSLEAPGMPAQMAGQMKQMMASKAAPHDFCLTPQDAAKGYEERVKKLAGRPDCHFDHYSAAAGKLDAQLTCTGQQGMRSVMTMAGTMGPQGSDITIGMDQSGPEMPGGAMKMTMHVKSERVGDCPKG